MTDPNTALVSPFKVVVRDEFIHRPPFFRSLSGWWSTKSAKKKKLRAVKLSQTSVIQLKKLHIMLTRFQHVEPLSKKKKRQKLLLRSFWFYWIQFLVTGFDEISSEISVNLLSFYFQYSSVYSARRISLILLKNCLCPRFRSFIFHMLGKFNDNIKVHGSLRRCIVKSIKEVLLLSWGILMIFTTTAGGEFKVYDDNMQMNCFRLKNLRRLYISTFLFSPSLACSHLINAFIY